MDEPLQYPEDLQLSDTFKEFVQSVRDYLRDYPDLNRLVDGVENSTLFLVRSVLFMLDDFAGMPPNLGFFTIDTLVNHQMARSICLLGTLAHILRSVLLLANRNTLSFSDGGINVNLEGRIPTLQSLEAQIRAEWRDAAHRKKIAMNIEGASGSFGMPSEYSLIHGALGAGLGGYNI